MATIKISALVPQLRNLTSLGDGAWVKIRPPTYEEELQRGQLISRRSYSYDDTGRQVIQVDVNPRLLWAEELWLTYQEANIDIEIEYEDSATERVTFDKPRGSITRGTFMENLAKLPPNVIYEWRAMMLDIVPGWSSPF